MSYRFFAIEGYEKIRVDSLAGDIYINCDILREPTYEYDLKKMGVDLRLKGDFSIVNKYINIQHISYFNRAKKFIESVMRGSNDVTHFTLKSDFSNLCEIYQKFYDFIKSIIKCEKHDYISVMVDNEVNYIEKYEPYSRKNLENIVFHTKYDFADFDNLEKYDFEVYKKEFPKFKNKIIFDGRFLKTQNFIIKYNKKPPFSEFEINIDKRVTEVNFGIYVCPKRDMIFEVHYNEHKQTFDVHLCQYNVNNSHYLKALRNIDWIPPLEATYTENDILNMIYDL